MMRNLEIMKGTALPLMLIGLLPLICGCLLTTRTTVAAREDTTAKAEVKTGVVQESSVKSSGKPSATGEMQESSIKALSKPSVLFIGTKFNLFSGDATQRHFLRDLADKHGFNVAFRAQEFFYYNQPGDVNPAEFRKYDVLVYTMPACPNLEKDQLTEKFTRQWSKALEFVKKGGGLLYMTVQTEPYQFSAQQCFKPLGLEPLKAIPVDTNAVLATVRGIHWSYTTQFDSQHPIMKDIRGLWAPVYPLDRSYIYDANSTTFRVSDDWRILARFGPGVRIVPYKRFEGPGRDLPVPTEDDKNVDGLLAVRELGQGRIAYFGVPSAYHILGGRAPGYEDIFLNKGLQGQASDGERLIVNILKWLAEPAQKNPDLGGAPTEQEAIARDECKPGPPVDKPTNFAPQPPGFKGIIGALSPRSGGESTVAEYAAKARENGFDWLVVLDDLETITEEQFQLLDKEAKAVTTEDFVCIPGIRCRDEVGNRYVAFRQGMRLPIESDLTKNRRFKTVRRTNKVSPLSCVGFYNWLKRSGMFKTAIVYYRDSKDLQSNDPYEYGVPPWGICPHQKFQSVFTYNEQGVRIDDMVEEHKTIEDDGEHIHPVAITFLKRGSDISKIGDGVLPYTVWWTDNLSRLISNTGEGIGADWRLPVAYATQGPIITRWQMDSHDMANNGKYWDWTYYYHRWALSVESEKGLDKVEVWDGKDLIRCWSLNGAKSFKRVIVVNKHQQTMPLVIATDAGGRKAVTPDIYWSSHNFRVNWCGDRFNTLSYSALPSPDSPWGSSAGTYPVPMQAKGSTHIDNLRVRINLAVLRMPGFDGQPNGGFIRPAFGAYTDIAQGQPRDGQPYRHITWPLGSQEVVIQESLIDHQFLPEQLLAGPGPIKPSEVVSGRLRYTTFVHWGHTPAPLLLEGELEFKQDVKMHPTQNPIPIGAIVPGDAKIGYRTVAVQRTGEQDRIYSIFYDKRDAQHVVGHLPYGGYIWYFPSMFGPMGVISLTDGMNYRLSHSERYNSISLSLGEPGQSFKKGDIVKWKYLAVASGFNDYSGIDTPERIIDLMGIDGSPGYDVEAVDGEVTDSRYMLTLKVGKDGAGFRGAIKPHKEVRRLGLPVALPLVLEGANNRWTAVLWDQGKKAMRPIPVAEGKAYAHFKELKRDRSIFMGHPFVCDDREIVLTVVQTGPKSLYLNVHNPTDVEKKVTIRRAAHFDAIPGIDKEKAMWTWVLAPGGEKHVNLGPKTVWTPVS